MALASKVSEEIKNRVKTLFVILTPFQYRMMHEVFGDDLFSRESFVFMAPAVSPSNGIHKGTIEPISFENFSFAELLRNPVQGIQVYRRRIGEIREYLQKKLDEFEIADNLNVVIGSDKDNFTQILLNLLYNRPDYQVRLYAVEEGLGYYVRENWEDHLKSFLYHGLTPFLFGEKLSYHKQLGTDQRILCRYVRLPELVPEFRGKPLRNIYKIKIKNQSHSREVIGGKVLIYSFPEGDFGMNESDKFQIFAALLSKLGDREIHVKPHPRETIEVFSRFPGIHVFNQSKPGETIDYFQYEQIVNFTSSVIIDILAQGYPCERITTIEMRKTGLPFFKDTRIIKPSELKKRNIEI